MALAEEIEYYRKKIRAMEEILDHKIIERTNKMNIVEELRNKKSEYNRKLLDRAADRIEELEAGCRKQSEWISVEERVPEKPGYFLGYTYKGVIVIAPFFSYYAVGDKPQFRYDITHWMPLPDAPKMKGGD